MNRLFSMLLLSSIAASAHAVKTSSNFSVSYTHDDNVTRAEKESDIQKDNVLSADASYSFKPDQRDTSYVSVRATLEGNLYTDFTKLTNIRQGIEFGFVARPKPGYTATRYHAKVKAEYRLFGSSLRSGPAFSADVGISQRLTDRLSLRAGWIPEYVMASSSVFQAFNNRFYADLGLRAGRKNHVYLTTSYMVGSVVTTALEDPALAGLYEAWAVDDAFQELRPTPADIIWAYKFGGSILSMRLGDTYSLSSSQSIDAAVQYYKASADAGVDYPGLIFNVNYIQRF